MKGRKNGLFDLEGSIFLIIIVRKGRGGKLNLEATRYIIPLFIKFFKEYQPRCFQSMT